MLHLQPCIHLHEVEIMLWVHYKLHCSWKIKCDKKKSSMGLIEEQTKDFSMHHSKLHCCLHSTGNTRHFTPTTSHILTQQMSLRQKQGAAWNVAIGTCTWNCESTFTFKLGISLGYQSCEHVAGPWSLHRAPGAPGTSHPGTLLHAYSVEEETFFFLITGLLSFLSKSFCLWSNERLFVT